MLGKIAFGVLVLIGASQSYVWEWNDNDVFEENFEVGATNVTCVACPYAGFSGTPNNCADYTLCDSPGSTLYLCPIGECFSDGECSCVPDTSTLPPGCPDCGFLAVTTTSDCADFIYCAEGTDDQVTCPAGYCFIQSTCSCNIV